MSPLPNVHMNVLFIFKHELSQIIREPLDLRSQILQNKKIMKNTLFTIFIVVGLIGLVVG